MAHKLLTIRIPTDSNKLLSIITELCHSRPIIIRGMPYIKLESFMLHKIHNPIPPGLIWHLTLVLHSCLFMQISSSLDSAGVSYPWIYVKSGVMDLQPVWLCWVLSARHKDPFFGCLFSCRHPVTHCVYRMYTGVWISIMICACAIHCVPMFSVSFCVNPTYSGLAKAEIHTTPNSGPTTSALSCNLPLDSADHQHQHPDRQSKHFQQHFDQQYLGPILTVFFNLLITLTNN